MPTDQIRYREALAMLRPIVFMRGAPINDPLTEFHSAFVERCGRCELEMLLPPEEYHAIIDVLDRSYTARPMEYHHFIHLARSTFSAALKLALNARKKIDTSKKKKKAATDEAATEA